MMLLHHARNILSFLPPSPPPPPLLESFFWKGLRNLELFQRRPNVHPHCLRIVSAAATQSWVAFVMYCTVPDFSSTWVSLRLHICTLCHCVTSEAEGSTLEIVTAHSIAFFWQPSKLVFNTYPAINLFSILIIICYYVLSLLLKR